MAKAPKKLRLSQNKIVGGVIGGFAEYFNVDVTLLRILFAALIVATGFFPGTMLYLVAWVIMMYADGQGTDYGSGEIIEGTAKTKRSKK